MPNRRPTRTRARHYIITLNNPQRQLSEYEQLFISHNLQFTAQFERGSEQTLHLQAFLRFPRPIELRGAKRIFGSESPHLESCRNPTQSEQYCRKENSRIEGPITNITAEEAQTFGQGKRTELSAVANAIINKTPF